MTHSRARRTAVERQRGTGEGTAARAGVSFGYSLLKARPRSARSRLVSVTRESIAQNRVVGRLRTVRSSVAQ